MRGNLGAWSWGDIQSIYAILGRQLQEYKRIADILHPEQYIDLTPKPGTVIPISKFENVLWIGKWHQDVERINEQLTCLDREIARRNNLIGVMG